MMRSRRRAIGAVAACASMTATTVYAQFGGRRREPSGSAATRGERAEGSDRRPAAAPADPFAAIERELPSLRVDLKLTAEQAEPFDRFAREVRNAAEAARLRARHVAGFRADEGKSVAAASVLAAIADDDMQRAEAAREARERAAALQAILTTEQRTRLDRRIVQALREPLGAS